MLNNSNRKYRALEHQLLSEQQELGKRIESRLADVSIEREPDDEAAQATYSVTRDMSAATLERERRTLSEVEAALKRLANGRYGICESCEATISDARLRALPWARLCISCASRSTAAPANYLRLRTAS
jgi:RNA polymerase-binding protein DksA